MADEQEGKAGVPADARVYGGMLALAAALSVALVMAHPRLTAHDLPGVMRQLVEGAAFNGWIHGLLMALNLVLVTGFYGLSRRLGLDRPLVALALIAYAFGALAMLAAAVVNGFALATFAGRYAELGPDRILAAGASLNAMGSMAAIWAAVGAVAGSAAIAFWSLRLLALPGAARFIGGVGILLGVATVAMLVAGALVLDVHGLLLLVGSQAAWTIAVGVQLIRPPLGFVRAARSSRLRFPATPGGACDGRSRTRGRPRRPRR